MVTGMKKRDKITEIFFDEQSPVINIRTYNTDLKNRLTRFSIEYPDECKLVDDSGNGHRRQKIEIYYKAIGIINIAEDEELVAKDGRGQWRKNTEQA